jgi:uncharacterized protein YndB with AHSA1/START domain
MRPAAVLVAACTVLLAAAPTTARSRKPGPQLVQIITPAGRAAAPAHPDVNLVVRFTGADPGSIRARLNGQDVTDRFRPVLERGKVVGSRATVPADILRLGRRRSNRLRIIVKAQRADAKGRFARQIARVRFRAVEADNGPPVANIVPDSEVLIPDLPVSFDGSQSFDPELDELTYQWDLGDGIPAEGVAAARSFPDGDEARTVTLTVSDGQASASTDLTLRSCPQPEGTTPGLIQVEADGPLEFGSVAPGDTATRTFEVVNRSTEPTSRLVACLDVDGGPFTLSESRLEIGPGDRRTVTVTFAPTAEGHTTATLVLVAAEAPGLGVDRRLVALLARGYGGTASGTGPTFVSEPFFWVWGPFQELRGLQPGGSPFTVEARTGLCASATGGFGSGDLCLVDRDCQAGGGVCDLQRASLPDVTDVCGDGAGGVYVLSEDTFFSDPNEADKDYPDRGTLVRFSVDGGGATVARTVLGRVAEDTAKIACDRFSAADGGRLFVAQPISTPESGNCFRDTREELLSFRKSDGQLRQRVMERIDAARGVSECDDIDNVTHLEVSRDGAQAFASFDSGGVWRVRPTPLQYLDSSFFEDQFRVHPDGSVVFVTVRDGPTKATVSVYKVTPAQVAGGALPANGIPPCATFQLPNNRKGSSRSVVSGFAMSPVTAGTRDATILVSLRTPGLVDDRSQPQDVQRRIRNLQVNGTIAFSSPADATSCTPLGVVNLESMDQLTF